MRTALVVTGIILLLLAAGAYAFTVKETDSIAGGLIKNEDTSSPYRNFAFPLLIAGVLALIVGAVMSDSPSSGKKTKTIKIST